jgi:hypothetical protein
MIKFDQILLDEDDGTYMVQEGIRESEVPAEHVSRSDKINERIYINFKVNLISFPSFFLSPLSLNTSCDGLKSVLVRLAKYNVYGKHDVGITTLLKGAVVSNFICTESKKECLSGDKL